MKKAGNGPYDRSQNLGPKLWNCFRILDSRGPPQTVWAVWVDVVLTYALNGCLVCIGPGMAVDCGFTK